MTKTNGFCQHIWTNEQVERFWNYESNFPGNYWGRNCATGFYSHIRREINQSKTILDMGCGDGALIESLLPHVASDPGRLMCGLDLSVESVAKANSRLTGKAGFEGCFAQLDEVLSNHKNGFDLILCTEVVEHLYDEQLAKLLLDANKLLSSSGVLVITTPNNENLDAGMICNPLDGSLFHRWQHVRSWSKDSLSTVLINAGFKIVQSIETNTLWNNAGVLKNLYRRFRYKEKTTLILKVQKN